MFVAALGLVCTWIASSQLCCPMCAGQCDSGWKEYQYNCYYVSTFVMNAIMADFFCKGRDATLASILDPSEQAFVQSIS